MHLSLLIIFDYYNQENYSNKLIKSESSEGFSFSKETVVVLQETVLKVQKEKIEGVDKEKIEELATADEAFISSSTKRKPIYIRFT